MATNSAVDQQRKPGAAAPVTQVTCMRVANIY